MRQLFCLVFFIVAPAEAFALDKFLSIGFASGGSSLEKLTGNQGYDIDAGAGLSVSGGIIVPVSDTVPHAFEAQLGIGYLFRDQDQEENFVSFSRIPVEGIYYYKNTENRFRLGWGAIYHFENKIRARGAYSTAAGPVDPSLGWALAAQKMIGSKGQIALGLRYVGIKYRSSRFSGEADGSGLGLTLEGQFF